ncbi:MAG TPA: hypothetical protein VM779_03735 [Thermoanaerobaculia bacterium]|nr:hypothetical protein [Thermoanaerobaculia bacterium]
MRVEIRSRLGNIVVGILGVVYAAAGLVLFAIHFVQTWGAASLTDRAIQLLLIAVIAVSGWFVSIAVHGLGVQPHRRGGARATLPA